MKPEFLERPTFTIGQVWFDFVKRLPRSSPRYKRDISQAEIAYQEAMRQAPPLTPEQMQRYAQQQMGAPFDQQQYGTYPYGNILGGLFR